MKLRQRKRAHMRNQRAQVRMVGRWMYYQHARVWTAIERSVLAAAAEGRGIATGVQNIGNAIIKDIQRIMVRKMVADIVGATQ